MSIPLRFFLCFSVAFLYYYKELFIYGKIINKFNNNLLFTYFGHLMVEFYLIYRLKI